MSNGSAADEINKISAQVVAQGALVKDLKAKGAAQENIKSEVDKLKELKQKLAELTIENEKKEGKFNRAALESLLVHRFFYAPSFSIYGGVTGLYDYGPPGCALQNNILQIWRQFFVLEENMLEIECTNLTPEAVLKTSGHVERFADYMVRDTVKGDIFRADHLVKQVINQRLDGDLKLKTGTADKKAKATAPLSQEVVKEYETILETLDNYQGDDLHQLIVRLDIRAPESGNPVTKPELFNLMFQTQIGPTGQYRGFLRPETAQGHFLNFKKLYEYNNSSMPFASASIGKSFRNEISPRQGLLRVREFTMAEIEHYVDPDNKEHSRFNDIKDTVLPLYSAKNQMSGEGIINITVGEAVEKGIINNETLGYFVTRIYKFLIAIGIDAKRLRLRQHMANEMAHYACDCWDAEIESSYGWIECVGCADRSAYDLTAHTKATGEKLVVREPLPEPIVEEKLILEKNKSKFGKAFRQNAVHVDGYLKTLMVDEENWDEQKLKVLDESIKANGSAKITGIDGNEYELTADMISFNRKTFKTHVREFIPSVIEPSFGIGRIIYQLLEHSYYVREGDEQRAVFKFPPAVAPTKLLILPISNNSELAPFVKDIASKLRYANISNKVDDNSGSIGRRYARNDELGIPFAITVDFQTAKDQTVTLRDRDSTKQIRAFVDEIITIVQDIIEGRQSWDDIFKKFPEFKQQEV